jgi:hypothetical protein
MKNTLRALRSLPVALCVGAALGGCATIGSGSGTVASTGAPVTFAWQGQDPMDGTITATLADGRTFSGTFEQLAPRGYLGSWVKDSKDADDIASSRVVARLESPAGERMACRFRLDNRVGGIVEGARGECRFGGQTIAAVLSRSLPAGV